MGGISTVDGKKVCEAELTFAIGQVLKMGLFDKISKKIAKPVENVPTDKKDIKLPNFSVIL